MRKPPRATFYVQLEPVYGYHYGAVDDSTPIDSARAVAVTQKKPGRPRSHAVIVKLTIELPAEAFRPLHPEAVITIPASLVQSPPVQVTAEEPEA